MEIALIIIVVLFVLIVVASAYYGAFAKVDFRIEEQGGEVLVYENLSGDYGQTPAVMDRVYRMLLNDERIETTKGFGIYHDDPKRVEKSKLRSEIGCVVEDVSDAVVARLSAKYHVKTFPRAAYVVTDFPYRGKLSVLFGIMKVYPALEKYCRAHSSIPGPVMELYDVPNQKITYRKAAGK